MKNVMYKITINNFEKHQEKLKKGHKAILISTGFLSHPKVQVLSAVNKLLYLSCLLVAGESTSSQIEVSHKSLCSQSGVKSGSLQSQLDLLQSLQLLTYEKIDLLINIKGRIEGKTEEKRKEIPARSKVAKPETELNAKIWQAYRSSYLARHKVEPIRNASVNAKISQLAKRLGEDAVAVVQFYLLHNDGFYLKNLHPIGLCLSNAESLHTQMKRGKAITANDVRDFEKRDQFQSQIERIEKGQV